MTRTRTLDVVADGVIVALNVVSVYVVVEIVVDVEVVPWTTCKTLPPAAPAMLAQAEPE
jgi:hypothetical protein